MQCLQKFDSTINRQFYLAAVIQESDWKANLLNISSVFSATIQRVVYSGGKVEPLAGGGRGARWRRRQGNAALASLIDRRNLPLSGSVSHFMYCIALVTRLVCFMM